jgi:hypothetical protein
VYSPVAEMLPTLGLIVQVTAVFVVPVTVAVNCWVWPAVRVALGGLTETPMTLRLTVAPPDLVASATPVAVTVTAWELVMLAGAVYSPLAEMLPTLGLIVQVTAVFVVPVTVAVNCWVWPAVSVTLGGLTETPMTLRLTVAPPDLVASATLVAVTVTAWELVMLAGAVYRPVAEMLPTLGLIDQVAAVFVVPVTVAVNCWV